MNLDKIENNIKTYFRSLDYSDYLKTFEHIPVAVSSIRGQVRGADQDVVIKTYGVLAEEVAHLLLRMYKSQHESEIVESFIFEYEANQTTEIDLIYITRNMIYIIECKHRSNDIELTSDGSFLIGDRKESPINQNVNHIKKLFGNMSYANLIPAHRVKNIVFLLFNDNARMKNPVTLFTKGNLEGAFAGYSNLLPLINKFEQENPNGKIPVKTIVKDLSIKGQAYEGKDGMKKHIANINRRFK